MRIKPLIGSLLFCALFAFPAQATIKHAPRVERIGDARLAKAGDLLEQKFRITPPHAGLVSDVEVTGEGWNVLSARTSDLARAKGSSFELTLTAIPSDPTSPLELEMMVDGHLTRTQLRLSDTVGNQPLQSIDGAEVHEIDASQLVIVPIDPTDAASIVVPDIEPGKAPRTVTVSGQLAFQRTDGTLIGVDGAKVEVWEEDIFDSMRASGVTNANGNFSLSFFWDDSCLFCEPNPDIYVRFESVNSKVAIRDGFFSYSFRSNTTQNFTGTSLNVGILTPTNEQSQAALGFLTNLTRGWRFLLNNEGLDTNTIVGIFPDDAGTASYYSPFLQEIHLRTASQWQEWVHMHEYGHHVINMWGNDEPVQYCNNICDPDFPDDCGHCVWCQERQQEAWTEGWPNWYSRLMTDTFSPAALNALNTESLNTCSGVLDTAMQTEGFLMAVLRDIQDSSNEDDPLTSGFQDRLSLGSNEIFDVSFGFNPTTPGAFFSSFRASFPQHDENLWETLRNNNFQLDSTRPGSVTSLSSSSHPINQQSPDTTPSMSWSRASDDFSGIGGYSVAFAASATLPNTSTEIGDVTSYTPTTNLAPGTYYFNIRAVDNAGNWSNNFTSYGPFIVREPIPANLVYDNHTGWADLVVPRDATGATGSSCPAPTSLPGNTSTTYWNHRGYNAGESSTGTGFKSRCYVDGVARYWATWSARGAGSSFWGVNLGPFNVKGGRHTFETRIDDDEAIPETNEVDNDWARQWIWNPLWLNLNEPVTRATPPDRIGGWDAIPAGVTNWYNCDGLLMFLFGGWNATYVRALNDANDYDVRSHSPIAGVSNGFAQSLAWSSRPAGRLDAIFSGPGTGFINPTHIGVLNMNDGSGSYEAVNIISQDVGYDTPITASMGATDYMLLRSVVLDAAQVGNVSAAIDIGPGQGAIRMAWLSSTLGNADMADFVAETVTDASGRARLDLSISDIGRHCVVLWRDPVDIPAGKAPASVDIAFEVQRTPPDLVPHQPSGWHAELIPRPANDGTSGSVPMPTELHGNVASTYLNMSAKNDSPTSTGGGWLQRVYVDGSYNWWVNWSNYGGGVVGKFNWSSSWTVKGGRHTLTTRLDPLSALEEKFEDNNSSGEQWVWSPLMLGVETPIARSSPPTRTGGAAEVSSGEPFWYNCDGLRTPDIAPVGQDGWWGAVAIIPTSGDADVRLHEVVPGVKGGFSNNLNLSVWGPGQSDFILVNHRNTPGREFDVGVIRDDGSSSAPYTVEYVKSSYLGDAPVGVHGPFDLAANRILDLHELDLPVGEWTVELRHAGGAMDWGLSLYEGGVAYEAKTWTMPGGLAYINGESENETITVSIDETAGKHLIAVWKTDSAYLTEDASYELVISASATGVDDVPGVVATALRQVYPNPFNPRTTIAFDLAKEGPVRLSVYNARGELVRTLVNENRGVGRHEAQWSGFDDSGAPVSSGTYFAQLEAEGRRMTEKMVLIK